MVHADVAVDAALESGVKFWQSLEAGTDTLAPFVRVYSEATTLRQWQDDREKLTSPYHLDSLRHAWAMKDPQKWPGYLRGRNALEQYGKIDDEGTYKEYTRNATELGREVMENARAVFSTIATCQSRILYEQRELDGDLVWHFKATSIIVDEAGTVHRPHLMIAIMAFETAKRLVLAGDPNQLPPFILSEGAKEIWVASYLNNVRDFLFFGLLLFCNTFFILLLLP